MLPGASAAAPAGAAPLVVEAPAPVATNAIASSQALEAPALDPIPHGRWRLTPLAELLHVTLRLTHILIRHSDSPADQVSFNLTGWRSPHAPVTRTRLEAWRLAEQVAERARRDPDRFAELAREVSEDVVTRAAGGSLGAISASQFWTWPEVLDALAATRPGAISSVVETEFGFHVFRLGTPAPERWLSGARIVIGHKDAPFLRLVARHSPPRSRAEALALAERLYREAQAAPDAFDELVKRHSEHEDAERQGDFGAWSSRKPTPWSRELETLEGLEVGAIAPPLDTTFGFQILRRTPYRPRPHYAMAKLQLRFDPSLPDHEIGSRAIVLQEANSLAELLREQPAEFERLQREVCCKPVLRVVAGTDSPSLEALLERLEPGQIGPEPIESSNRYLIVKRLELAALPPEPATSTELPTAPPNLRAVAHQYTAAFLAEQFGRIGALAAGQLGLTSANTEQFIRQHARWQELSSEAPSDARLHALEAHGAELRKLLDTAQLERYQAIAMQRFEAALLELP